MAVMLAIVPSLRSGHSADLTREHAPDPQTGPRIVSDAAAIAGER